MRSCCHRSSRSRKLPLRMRRTSYRANPEKRMTIWWRRNQLPCSWLYWWRQIGLFNCRVSAAAARRRRAELSPATNISDHRWWVRTHVRTFGCVCVCGCVGSVRQADCISCDWFSSPFHYTVDPLRNEFVILNECTMLLHAADDDDGDDDKYTNNSRKQSS